MRQSQRRDSTKNGTNTQKTHGCHHNSKNLFGPNSNSTNKVDMRSMKDQE